MKSAEMVDISSKSEVERIAVVKGRIKLRKETIEKIRRGEIEKGDVITVAKVAGILAAKKTPEIIPLCHPIPLTNIRIDIEILDDYVEVTAMVKTVAKTGVEMEALTATTVSLLTIWDMVKKYEKDEKGQYPYTRIEEVRVIEKVKR